MIHDSRQGYDPRMPRTDATAGDSAPSSQRRKGAAAREAILAAARSLIAEDGFGGAQMSLIALRARVGVGSIYKHFASREELFAEIYSEVAAREFEHVEA